MGNDKLEKLKLENGWTGLTPEKKEILKNHMGSITLKGGNIQLDENNWDHIYWLQDDEKIEDFMDDNKESIIEYASVNQKSLRESVDVLYRLKVATENFEKVLPKIWEQAERNMEEMKQKWIKKNNPVRFSDMSEKDRKESMEAMDDSEEHDPKESLKQALIEVKLIKEGKLKAKTWDELYKELKNIKVDE